MFHFVLQVPPATLTLFHPGYVQLTAHFKCSSSCCRFHPRPSLCVIQDIFSELPTSNVPLCFAGSTRVPHSVSSRIIFLSLLLLSLFLSTSYSAIIVSLLQTTSTAINSLRDLMDSPFTLIMNEIASNMYYVNVSSNITVSHIND